MLTLPFHFLSLSQHKLSGPTAMNFFQQMDWIINIKKNKADTPFCISPIVPHQVPLSQNRKIFHETYK